MHVNDKYAESSDKMENVMAAIAHISIRKFMPVLISLLLLLIGAFTLVTITYVGSKKLLPVAIYVLVGGTALSALLIATIVQLILNHGRAIWIESGELIYLNRLFFVVDCAEIEAFSEGRSGMFQERQIFVTLKDGSKKGMPAGAFTEPVDVVIAKLNSVILPDGVLGRRTTVGIRGQEEASWSP
jgi:hypothetical protein